MRIGAGTPLYVLRTERSTNTVVVGPRSALGATRIEASGRLYVGVDRVEAKLRYRSAPVSARVRASDGGFALELVEPVDAVARGQVAVLYDHDAVVGAGVVSAVGRGH